MVKNINLFLTKRHYSSPPIIPPPSASTCMHTERAQRESIMSVKLVREGEEAEEPIEIRLSQLTPQAVLYRR